MFETGYGVYRIFGPGVDEVLGENKATGSLRYIHHDALGSVTAATSETGVLKYRRTYRAFGQIATATAADDADQISRYAFTGRELSVGTFMQYRSRWHDTAYGRFTSSDAYRGNDLVPPSLHQYVYTANNPVNFADPTGQTSVRMPPHMDELLGHTFDVIARLFAFLAVAGITRSPAVGAVLQWLTRGAEELEQAALRQFSPLHM